MAKLIKLNTIVLVDNYIDESTLTMLSKRNINIPATIYTRQLSQQQQLDVQRHNQQYPPISIITTQRNHDRFLIIDDVVYIFWGKPERRRQEALCLHQNARDITSRTAQSY